MIRRGIPLQAWLRTYCTKVPLPDFAARPRVGQYWSHSELRRASSCKSEVRGREMSCRQPQKQVWAEYAVPKGIGFGSWTWTGLQSGYDSIYDIICQDSRTTRGMFECHVGLSKLHKCERPPGGLARLHRNCVIHISEAEYQAGVNRACSPSEYRISHRLSPSTVSG